MPLAALGFWLALSCSAAGPRLGIDAAPGMETPGLDPSPSLQLITPLLLPGSAIQVVTPPAEAAATSALENAGPLAALGLKPHPTPRDIARLQAALSPWSGAGLDLHPDPERLAALFTGEQAAAGKTGLIVPQAPAPEGFRNEGGLLLAQPRPDAVLEAASQDRAEVLAAIEGPDFLRQPQARQEAALERLSQLWELGSKPRPEPLLSLLAARPPLAVRERVYDLLDRLGPAYFSSQQEGLLLKAIDRNPGDELLPAGQAALGRAAGELAGLSESGYHHYLNILSRQPLAFHAEGLPGFSPQTSFGIELEFAAVDRELNKSDRSATEALEAHLMERIPRLIEKGELAPGWVIKHDGDGNPEINTPVLTNDRAGFEELGRGLSNIRSLLDSWFKDKPHALAQGMHIHVGTPSPSIERDAALAFLGKAMERLWASLSPTNDLGMVAFKPGALFGDAHTGKNNTFWYTDTRKGTVAFNAFAPVPFPSGDFIERLQAAVGVAMQVALETSAHPELFNVLDWGLPLPASGKPWSAEDSLKLRRGLDRLYASNAEGKASVLRLLLRLGRRPERDGGSFDKRGTDPTLAWYEEAGLGPLHEAHEKAGGLDAGQVVLAPMLSRLSPELLHRFLGHLAGLAQMARVRRLLKGLDSQVLGNLPDFFFPGKILNGHVSMVESVSFSPDGRTLASGSWDRTVRLWDVATGKKLHVLRGHANWVRSVSFSPDGRTLASGAEDGTIRLWDVATGEELQVLREHGSLVRSVSFSPDGRTLASGSKGTVRLWDVATGEELHVLRGHTNWVTSVSFSPDGRTLASGSEDGTIRLWRSGFISELR